MKDPLALHKTIKLASDYSKLGTVEDFKNAIEFMNGMEERKHMSDDIVWYKCSEQLPVYDGVLRDIFIILRKIPYAVFTGCYDPSILEMPFYICGLGRERPNKVLYWAEVPDGFMPEFDVKEIVEYEDTLP